MKDPATSMPTTMSPPRPPLTTAHRPAGRQVPFSLRQADTLPAMARALRVMAAELGNPALRAPSTVASTASAQLAVLGRMTRDASTMLIAQLKGPHATDPLEMRAAGALADASAGSARAMGPLAEALRQCAFLGEHARTPAGADLADARAAAWSVIEDRLDEALLALEDTATQLEGDIRRTIPASPRPSTSRTLAPAARPFVPPAPSASPARR